MKSILRATFLLLLFCPSAFALTAQELQHRFELHQIQVTCEGVLPFELVQAQITAHQDCTPPLPTEAPCERLVFATPSTDPKKPAPIWAYEPEQLCGFRELEFQDGMKVNDFVCEGEYKTVWNPKSKKWKMNPQTKGWGATLHTIESLNLGVEQPFPIRFKANLTEHRYNPVYSTSDGMRTSLLQCVVTPTQN
jgi:hypothetical protein